MASKKGQSKGKSGMASNKTNTKRNIFAGTGISKNDDPFKAGQEAVQMAIKNMKAQGTDKGPDFGFVFCSGGKYGKDEKTIKKLVDGAHQTFINANPDCKWIGCTTAGEISNYGSTTDSTVCLTVNSQYIHIGVGSTIYQEKDPEKVGVLLAKSAFSNLKMDKYIDSYVGYLRVKKNTVENLVKMNPYLFVILGKGVEAGKIPFIPKIYDNDWVLRGAENEFKTKVDIIGGAAADNNQFKQNYIFENGHIHRDQFSGAAFFINHHFDINLSHGYKPTGKFAIATKVENHHWIKELNHRPAAEVYSELTGIPVKEITRDAFSVCKKHPFAVADLMGDYWLRVVGKFWNGGLYTGSIVNENTVLHIMEATNKNILASTKTALSDETKTPAFGLIFDCSVRRDILGEEINTESNIIKNSLKNAPFVGFYTFGEFGSPSKQKVMFHNQTVAVLRVYNDLLI